MGCKYKGNFFFALGDEADSNHHLFVLTYYFFHQNVLTIKLFLFFFKMTIVWLFFFRLSPFDPLFKLISENRYR